MRNKFMTTQKMVFEPKVKILKEKFRFVIIYTSNVWVRKVKRNKTVSTLANNIYSRINAMQFRAIHHEPGH